MAVLGAASQKLLGFDVHLYTYGSPRVGNKNFADFFNNLITATNLRAVFRNDPVPTVPFKETL